MRENRGGGVEEGERVTLWKCRFTVVSGSHASTRALFFPHSFSLCPLKNTWCKLTLAGGGSKGRKGRGKKGKDIGQRERIGHKRSTFLGLL